jgi:hypothetical protein
MSRISARTSDFGFSMGYIERTLRTTRIMLTPKVSQISAVTAHPKPKPKR